MQQSEIYFFGKLNQSRDFIVSENLQTNDKNFWDGWFDRCNNQDKLIPFTRKVLSASRIWLFCIKLPFYVGEIHSRQGRNAVIECGRAHVNRQIFLHGFRLHVAGIQQVKNIAQHCLPILVKIDDLIGACLFFFARLFICQSVKQRRQQLVSELRHD